MGKILTAYKGVCKCSLATFSIKAFTFLGVGFASLFSACAPLKDYAQENGHQYREDYGGASVLGKKDLASAPGEKVFLTQGVGKEKNPDTNAEKRIIFSRNPSVAVNVPFLGFLASLGGEYAIEITNGYVRRADVIYPSGFLSDGSSEKVIYSELGTGPYREKAAMNGTLGITTGWMDKTDKIVGVKSKTFQASTSISAVLVKGVSQDFKDLGIRLKYDSLYAGEDGQTIANIHIIADDAAGGLAWRPDVDQTPKLRASGSSSGTARGLVWNSARGLRSIKGEEYRLPMARAGTNEDVAVIMVGENSFILLKLNSIGNNGADVNLTIQRVYAQ